MSLKTQPITGVVIVAAGRGERVGLKNGPKQYRDIGGMSVLARTMRAFLDHRDVDHVIVVIHGDDKAYYAATCPSHPKLLPPVLGGETRQLSVLAGLEALPTRQVIDHVLIHDAARPFVENNLVSRVLNGLDNNAASLPALAVADTLKRGNKNHIVQETVSREGLYAAQTPQGFEYDRILKAHLEAVAAGKTDFTDDAALAEWAGIPVTMVDGSADNTKITTADDLRRAQEKFAMNIPDIRVGHGYDTHKLETGTHIWLCGVELPHTHKLSGHSDADVGLHALTDALLATIADGDIGSHFPPDDPKWKDARSDQFLKHAVTLVRAAGGTITHMDVTLICEAPKIAPHRNTMRGAISAISGVDTARISVKATTNEKVGFVGRGEGMVALATATVVMGAGK